PSLPAASGDEKHLRVSLRGPSARGNRRADISSLGVVGPAHPARCTDQLGAMREPFKLAQRREQGLKRQCERAAKRERGECVGGVVQSRELHFSYSEERVCALREPGLAAERDQTPVP